MNVTIRRLYKSALPLLLVVLLCSCTAKSAEVDESGLPPHLTVNLLLPENVEIVKPNHFSVEVLKSGKPMINADQAQFIIWQEDDQYSAVTIQAEQLSPGVYSVTHSIAKEGLYVVQSRIHFANDQVMPAKRFAIGKDAIEKLAMLESAQHSGEPAPVESGHHH